MRPRSRSVVQVIVVGGVAGNGEKVSAARAPVASGLVGSPQSAKSVVVTTPANALFLVTGIVTAPLRSCVEPIVTWDGRGEREVRDRHQVPEYTAARISSPGAYRSSTADTTIPAEFPSMIPTWSLGSGGAMTDGNAGPG